MPRSVPLAPYTPPNPGVAVPFAAVRAGSSALTGHWRDLGRSLNLGYSDGCAGNVVSQWWLDSQFISATAAGVYQNQCSWRVPEISGAHLAVRCRIYASGGAPAVGSVRFASTTGGATVTLTPIGAAGWYSTSGADLAVAFAGGYETLTLSCAGNVTILGVQVTYLAQDSLGAWPANDGALVAGPDGAFVPIDELETTSDEPLASDMATTMRDNITALATRQRVLVSTSSVDAAAVSPGFYTYLDPRQFLRFAVPTRYDGTECRIYVRATNSSGGALPVYVQVGGQKSTISSAVDFGTESVDVTSFDVANGAASTWTSSSFTVRDQIDPVSGGAPLRYPGFALAAVSWDAGLDIERVCVWG